MFIYIFALDYLNRLSFFRGTYYAADLIENGYLCKALTLRCVQSQTFIRL